MSFGIKEFAFISFMLGVVAGAYGLVVRPHAASREQQQAQIASMDAAIQSLSHTTENLEAMEKTVDRQSKAVVFFRTKLPGATETDKVVQEITEMATANSLQTISIHPLPPRQVTGYVDQPIELIVSGDFNGFYSFVQQVEKLPHTTRVTRMTLQTSKEHDGNVRASMTTDIFQTGN